MEPLQLHNKHTKHKLAHTILPTHTHVHLRIYTCSQTHTQALMHTDLINIYYLIFII